MMITLLVLLPLLGFFLNGFYHFSAQARKTEPSVVVAGVIGTIALFAAFALAVVAWLSLGKSGAWDVGIEERLFSWMKLGTLHVEFGYRLDRLSGIFTLVITGVGSLIHLYSIGYMENKGSARYFAYLNLFCFMMLNLVLGSSLPLVFLGWEGVGLASYLLIGFWSGEMANIMAAQKAFLMNRVGDLGLLFAMFIAFKFAGTLDLADLSSYSFKPEVATAFGLLIFLACTGKSAQIPLFTWLPDAMAGPTPVSALIHAATMVTSGIYLLARLNPVMGQSPTVLFVIAAVGAGTALMSAITACFQSDIKKVLAYSTISQLGFMFVACGVGSPETGVFHVMTHAFFKALLFLGAGSVIHALSGTQDIFKMGGLRSSLPLTFWTFTAGWAAILGLPPFSGFFSKDGILHESLVAAHGSRVIFAVLAFTAFLTAFYMTRLYILVFFGQSRLSEGVRKHVHESPIVMTLPLLFLGLAALAGGWFGAPVRFESGHHGGVGEVSPYLIMVISVFIAAAGAFLGYRKYFRSNHSEKTRDPFRVDEIYTVVFGRGTEMVASFCSRFIEEGVFQRILQFSGAAVDLGGNLFKTVQTGSAQGYLLMMVLAVVALVCGLIFGVHGYGN
ncbi:MAG: NADH-quinone oxidoreductase subunit L [Bdellovibrionales bacterium]|nr:NADH-quinone oxidoreductase subunit L [Bdellovibrionales bacterium]